MTIKNSLLIEILEKLASLRMIITIRLDDDSAYYILICIDFTVIEYDNSWMTGTGAGYADWD